MKAEINGFLDLDGMVIAVQKETTSDILMSDYIDTKTITATISANEKIATCFAQLTAGEVDAVVVELYRCRGLPGLRSRHVQDRLSGRERTRTVRRSHGP